MDNLEKEYIDQLKRKMVNPYPQKEDQPAKNAVVKIEKKEVSGNRKKKASSLKTVDDFQYSPLYGRQGKCRPVFFDGSGPFRLATCLFENTMKKENEKEPKKQ
ncbi:hypothetical protein DAPPUDRAFT_110090 [Daphnia pulex]|uniref:Uncharacterized protein n=1 Tax=Daphnia pulex TaxID=6669 RepID=E9H565_DAPPU|nr:hypothetical protein DAPPUDRAFT_110090 [Daphnia pulex]|eukprot:EFX73131.1 hypothetical protein DAPPUDRAFT_110090 [Daphnia pulex]